MSVRDRIKSMNSQSSVSLKTEGAKRILKSRNSEGSTRVPLQLPGMFSDKGASKYEEETPQETDVEEVIQRLKDNDPSLTEVNLNNHGGLDSDLIEELFDAMKENTCLEKLLLSNVKVDENHASVLAEVLVTNCTLKVLNLESNRITRKGIKAIMKALADNQDTVLKELRMVNQYFAGGAGAEGEIAKYLDKVKTITKLGYNFTVPSFRSKVDGFIMRNLDYERKRRAAMNA